jgi:hypothetical protein
MSFGQKVLEFYKSLDISNNDFPDDIEVMVPMKDDRIQKLNTLFYNKYYNDNDKRIFLIGINPGRFGGGVTGIPFTDPIHLQEVLQIKNTLPKRHEMSSKFVYQVVKKMGGPDIFFKKCYLTAVSPLGFLLNDKNINYYDSKKLLMKFEDLFIHWIKQQISFGANTDIAFSLGRGKNYDYLKNLNAQYHFFKQVIALPHPRWVMQYRFPERDKFVDLYLKFLNKFE